MGRFERSKMLFGEDFARLQNARVLVCGCGGVGGVCIDTLYRSGVVNLSVVDCDSFELSNQNRQIGSENLGEQKTKVFERLYPGVVGLECRLSAETVETLDVEEFDLVIDSIDDIPAKVALANLCARSGVPLISSMGGARRFDPTQIRVESVWRTKNDPFARKFRYELKRSGFVGDFKCVFSMEIPTKCEGLGSFKAVTAAFGLHLAALAVKNILKCKCSVYHPRVA